jgi:hypothetical protein
MVVDFTEGKDATLALRLLWEAGVAAVYLPDLILVRSPDPLATFLLVHRIEAPDAEGARVRATLDDYGLRPLE